MKNLLKLGVYVAAGVGTYELLRRYGLLEKAGEWLRTQVPDDLKQRAQDFREHVTTHARDYVHDAQDAVRRATAGYNEPMAEEADTARPASSHGNGNGRRSGQTITGSGQGVPVTTDELGGTHVPHKVGRGVVN